MNTVAVSELGEALEARNLAIGHLLLNNPDVTCIDIGYPIKESENRLEEGIAIRIHKRFKPKGSIADHYYSKHPNRWIDKKVIWKKRVDIIEAEYFLQYFYCPPPPLRGNDFNPLEGGVSISHEWSYSCYDFGTLGGIVIDKNTQKKMVLSNNHVLAGLIHGPPGLRIYQPGFGDGGRRQHTIARFTRNGMDVDIDAAVAELENNRKVINDQFGLAPVNGVAHPKPGMRVIKSGRGSKKTEGTITGRVDNIFPMNYWGYIRTIRHVFHIIRDHGSYQVSAGGDSGSWWLDKDTNKVVGLHFAGTKDGKYGLAISMPNVLNALNVDIMV
jgi:endonuclease G